MDRFSPVAPAAVRVQILPIGQIERTRFLDVLRELQKLASMIKLSDIDGDVDGLLSPKSSPDGCIFFNYTTSEPSEQHKQLAPYELFRDPLLVIGLVDGLSDRDDGLAQELKHATAYLRERHPRVVHRQILLLQETERSDGIEVNGVVKVGKGGEVDGGLLKAAMCKIAGRFLIELATYTKAMQASPSVQTPGQVGRSRRAGSLRGMERQSGSGYATPTQGNELSSPVDNETTSSPPPRGFGSPPPATTFDQMHGANVVPSGLARSDSNSGRNGNRTASQDRAAGHGLSKEKKKDKGKARVGIIVGHIRMMAGHWSDALRMLVEHTNKARLLSDRLWHAKGLDGILVCMLLLSWAGLEFQIPSICYPPADRSSSGTMSRFSVSLPSDFKPTDGAQQVSVRRLSTSMPEMLKQILDLYRMDEGGLELPSLLIYDSIIRFCKLMAVLFNANSELTQDVLASLVEDSTLIKVNRFATFRHTSLSKIAIDEILKQAQPSDDDGLAIDDRISILAGMATVYALLPMDRKKGLVLQDLVKTTTAALDQARKLGAAEMGIHPAASLSAHTSVDIILAILGDSGGVKKVMTELAGIYGAELLPMRVAEETTPQSVPSRMTPSYPGFGSAVLQSDVLKSIASFCEASPDPAGVLQVATSVLMSINPFTAVDTVRHGSQGSATREDQIRLATVIGRTFGVSKQMGLPGVQAEYWDPFLVRGLDIPRPDPSQILVPRSRVGKSADVAQQVPGNPLLYDPNASRPGTADVKARHILVRNEPSRCMISLQNPFDIPLEIEALQLVTDDDAGRLKCEFQPITVGPMCIQQVPVSVFPTSPGDIAITGCRVKVGGCREQLFPIVSQPWSKSPSLLVKSQGMEARYADDAAKPELSSDAFHRTQVLATSLLSQPLLQIDQQSGARNILTLLEGQETSVKIAIRNVSSIAASIFRQVGTIDVISVREDAAHAVAPGEAVVIDCDVLGRSGVNEARIDFYYASADPNNNEDYARVLPVPLAMTVKESLAIHDVEIRPINADDFALSFNLTNRYQKALSYHCEILTDPEDEHQVVPPEASTLVAAETAHIYLRVRRQKDNRSDDDIRDTLLQRLSIRWETCTGEPRHGRLHTTKLDLTQAQLNIIRGPTLDTTLELLDGEGAVVDSEVAVSAGSFVTVRVKLANRDARPTRSLFTRLTLPTDERRVGLIGVPTRTLGELQGKGFVTTDFALCLLSSGRTEVGVVAKAMGEQWQTERTMAIKVA